MSFSIRTSTFLLLTSLFLSVASRGQMTVTPTSTATALATALTGPGVTISSPVLTCNALSNGTFNVTPGTIVGTGPAVWGINSGVILSTGKVASAIGTAATLANYNAGMPGDAALTSLAGATTYDACILEFDIIPTGDTIKFDYIFGSEEYNNSTCGPYNDAFAFFISGPGITGAVNMALVPGTNIPVTVNSVNSGTPGAGYSIATCNSMGPGAPFTAYYNDNTGGSYFTMKGFTKVLTAMHDVTPCNTYHLKLTIADASNSLYDSEVFLKQGSIVSATNTVTAQVCAGANTTVSATPSGGTWSSANTGIATVDAVTGDVHGVAAGTVDLTYTTGSGCYKITSLTVDPTPSITGPTSVCTSLSVTVTATPAGGTWSGGAAGIATITSSGVATGQGIGVAPISYTSPAGCLATGTFSVFNMPAISGPSTVCQHSTITLADPQTGGTWSSNATGIATVVAATGVVGGASVGSATITYSLGGSCYATAAVSVIAQPAAPAVTSIQYCLHDPAAPLTATGASLLWYTTATGGTGTPAAPTPLTDTTGVTTWYVTQTVNGCEGPRQAVPVTVNPLPVFSIVGNNSGCLHDTLVFTAAGAIPVPASYTWSITPGLSLLPGGSLNANTLSVKLDTTINQVVWLTITDVNTGCRNNDSIEIVANNTPLSLVSTPENVCLGDTVILGLSTHSGDAATFQWWVDGLPLSSATAFNMISHTSGTGGPYKISWNSTGTHVIKLQAFPGDFGCPSMPVFDTVNVHALPDAQFSYKSFKTLPCIDDSIYFAARTYNVAYVYEWEPAHSFNDRTGHEAWAMIEHKQENFTLTVTDPFGCKASSTVPLNADGCCRVLFPTAFTPNNDGKNDLFRPIFANQGRTISGGPDTLTSYHRFHVFRIQNRWGQTVFETTNSYPQWDGTYGGVPQDMGVYYYVLVFDCDDNKVTQTGDITLVR